MDEHELIELLEVFDGMPNAAKERQEIAEQLANKTSSIHELLRCSNDPDVRVLAACALAELDPNHKVSALIALLREIGPESPAMHTAHAWGAAAALAAMGPAVHEAIPALRACLDLDGSGDESIRLLRLSSAEAIWRISGDTQTPLRLATEMLADTECNLRSDAAELLGRLGSAARPAVPELQRLLNDTEQVVRRHSAEALARISG